MVFQRPRISIALWVNMLLRAGWPRASAQELADQPDAELQAGAARADLKALELRLVLCMILIAGIDAGIIVAVN